MSSVRQGFALAITSTKARDAIGELLPPPAMGNMKPGTAEYAAKHAEKSAKIAEDAKDHPLFGMATRISAAWFEIVNGDYKVSTSVEGDFDEFLTWCLRYSSRDCGVVGPHPTTDCRMLLNNCIALGVAIPENLLPETPKINPWQHVCPPSEGEYPLVAKALGLYTGDPLLDSAVLAARLSLI